MIAENTPLMTLKVWDPSKLNQTLDTAVQDLASTHLVPVESSTVMRSGPHTYTAVLRSAEV
jgi:hypothetical protein